MNPASYTEADIHMIFKRHW